MCVWGGGGSRIPAKGKGVDVDQPLHKKMLTCGRSAWETSVCKDSKAGATAVLDRQEPSDGSKVNLP